jgi:polyisoprenoid-binding protein YceI
MKLEVRLLRREVWGFAMCALTALAATPVTVFAQQPGSALHLVLADSGNEARYRVREQLAALSFPSDAVGKTGKITGELIVEPGGKIDSGSKITVDLVSLATDVKARDTYVRRNILETATYTTIVFTPTVATGLPKVPSAGDVAFTLHGSLALHGVTKPVAWQVKGKMDADGEIAGTATTTFTFEDYHLAKPKVARVLSVVDSITLEYDFHFVPQALSAVRTP